MSGWSVFWAGVKGLFSFRSSMFEEIAQLALDKVNSALAAPTTAERLQKVVGTLRKAYNVMVDYADWCPDKWADEFLSIRSIVGSIVEALEDGKLYMAEVTKLVEGFKVAYAKWRA